MIKHCLLIFFLVGSVDVYCQQTWELVPTIERNAYTILEGTIDNKYPIRMYLEKTWDYCGPNDNYKWNPRIVRGWYEYKKIGKKIPLIGSLDQGDMREYALKLFVPDRILDTLDGMTCNLINYKEMFFIPEGYYSNRYCLDTMQWSKYGQERFLQVYLKETHPSTWTTTATLSFQFDKIGLLDFDLSNSSSNKFIDKIDIEASKEINGNFFFIVRWGHLTTPGWLGSGQCGAGWEEWLGMLVINNDLEISKFEYYQNESCAKYIDTQYSFDKEHPEKGISMKKY